MTAPQYISEDKSDMRGIKPGWYAMDKNGNLCARPFSSHEECLSRITSKRSDRLERSLQETLLKGCVS
jgi:hypothetical protein